MDDKALTAKLTEAGLTWDHARIAVGLIIEERQRTDLEGYQRGYNDGWEGCDKEWQEVTYM